MNPDATPQNGAYQAREREKILFSYAKYRFKERHDNEPTIRYLYVRVDRISPDWLVRAQDADKKADNPNLFHWDLNQEIHTVPPVDRSVSYREKHIAKQLFSVFRDTYQRNRYNKHFIRTKIIKSAIKMPAAAIAADSFFTRYNHA